MEMHASPEMPKARLIPWMWYPRVGISIWPIRVDIHGVHREADNATIYHYVDEYGAKEMARLLLKGTSFLLLMWQSRRQSVANLGYHHWARSIRLPSNPLKDPLVFLGGHTF